MRGAALRVPGGNQIDGLPPARHYMGAALASWSPTICKTFNVFFTFFSKVMRSLITRKAVNIFPMTFIKDHAWRVKHLAICSTKVKVDVGSSFEQNIEKMTFSKNRF